MLEFLKKCKKKKKKKLCVYIEHPRLRSWTPCLFFFFLIFFFSASLRLLLLCSLPHLSSFLYCPDPSVSISFSLFYMPFWFVANVPPREELDIWKKLKVNVEVVTWSLNVLRITFYLFLMCILVIFLCLMCRFLLLFCEFFFFFSECSGKYLLKFKVNFGVLFFSLHNTSVDYYY